MPGIDKNKVVMQWKEFEIPEVFERSKKINLDHNLITTITGPRRAGKTFLCF